MPYPEKMIILMPIMVLALGSTHRCYGEFILKEDCCSREHVDWSLNLTAVGIESLPNGFIENKFLTHLTLDSNRIQRITYETFVSVPSLTYLSLANNYLTTLDLRSFSGLKNLKTLILSGNPNNEGIRIDYEDPFDRFNPWMNPSITHLYAENSNIRQSLFGVYRLPSLTHLYVSYNPYMWTENTILDLESLAPAMTHLYLKGCGVMNLDVSRLSTVTSLHLDENTISMICNEFCEGLSLGIETAKRLITLSVSHNRINNIQEDAFKYTTNLVTLDLSYNQILRIPEGTFDSLQLLESLNLDNNLDLGISAVATLRNLTSLKSLSLQNTKMSNIHSNYFGNLLTLNKLMLSNNQISSIESGSFSKLVNLKELYLAGNQLTTISDDCLPYSGSLIHLQLEGNMFTSMDDISLTSASNILHLCIKNNPITSTSISWFKNAPDNLTIFWGNTCPQL